MQFWKNMSDKTVVIVRGTLSWIVAGILLRHLAMGQQGSVYLCVLTLWLFRLPELLEDRFRIGIPRTLELVVLLFVFASEILGEVNACYVRFPWWDGVLHGVSGFVTAAIGIGVGELLSREKPSAALSLLCGFCFSMAVGALWELLEWSVDLLFALDMQKDTIIERISSVCLDPAGGNRAYAIGDIRETVVILRNGSRRALEIEGYLDVGLMDTMGDLLANLVGAALFCVGIRIDRRNYLRHCLIPKSQSNGER